MRRELDCDNSRADEDEMIVSKETWLGTRHGRKALNDMIMDKSQQRKASVDRLVTYSTSRCETLCQRNVEGEEGIAVHK
jgi:hypothetical protein